MIEKPASGIAVDWKLFAYVMVIGVAVILELLFIPVMLVTLPFRVPSMLWEELKLRKHDRQRESERAALLERFEAEKN